MKSTLILALTALHISSGLAAPLEERSAGVCRRNAGVCNSGLYNELVPFLATYSPALAFCSDVFPVPCTTAAPKLAVRAPSAPPSSTTKPISTTVPTTTQVTTTTKAPSTTTTNTNQDPHKSAWSKCQQQPWNVISTLCACIEVPKVCSSAALQ